MFIPPKPKCDLEIRIKCLALFNVQRGAACWLIHPFRKLRQACGERVMMKQNKLDWIGRLRMITLWQLKMDSQRLKAKSNQPSIPNCQPPAKSLCSDSSVRSARPILWPKALTDFI